MMTAMLMSTQVMPSSRGLWRFFPAKAGNARAPTPKIICMKKPTARAWRAAPCSRKSGAKSPASPLDAYQASIARATTSQT